MPNKTADKIANKIKTLLTQKEKKIEIVKKTNDEIKKIDADLKKLNEAKANLEKAEQDANNLLGLTI